MVFHMVKTIRSVGNSPGIVSDAALMDLAQLKAGEPEHEAAIGIGHINAGRFGWIRKLE